MSVSTPELSVTQNVTSDTDYDTTAIGDPEVRRDKVDQARAKLAGGCYDTDKAIDAAVDGIVFELSASPHS